MSQSAIEHDNICGELTALYEKKNRDYGDSFHKSYEKYGLTMAAIRLGDKFSRFEHLVLYPNDQQIKDESIRDTLIDLANYAIMTVMELDREKSTESHVELQDILAPRPKKVDIFMDSAICKHCSESEVPPMGFGGYNG